MLETHINTLEYKSSRTFLLSLLSPRNSVAHGFREGGSFWGLAPTALARKKGEKTVEKSSGGLMTLFIFLPYFFLFAFFHQVDFTETRPCVLTNQGFVRLLPLLSSAFMNQEQGPPPLYASEVSSVPAFVNSRSDCSSCSGRRSGRRLSRERLD